jgi:hypothetical protein
MQTGIRIPLPINMQHGTHAQTLQRDGFMRILGRPPFNYSTTSPMRKAGFLSTGSLLDANEKTIFMQCKSVRQCFKDTFTHLGLKYTRQVYVEKGAVGVASNAFMREWHPSDASKCGIFGIWLHDESTKKGINRMCEPTLPDDYYCCAVDMAVAPLFYLFHNHPQVLDELEPVCNRPFLSPTDTSYEVFRKSEIKDKVKQIGK